MCYSKKIINKKVKKDIPELIRNVILDLLLYLDKKGFDIKEYITKINKTDFIVAKENVVQYKYIHRGKNKVTNIPIDKINGMYVPIMTYDDVLDRPCILSEVVIINTLTDNTNITKTIVHELFHLLSSGKIYKFNGGYYQCSGLMKNYYYLEKQDYDMPNENYINEAITDVLAYKVMEEVYHKQFKVETRNVDGKEIKKFSRYYLITDMMWIFNYKFNNSTDTKVLLDLYLNNKIDDFYNLSYENFNLEKSLVLKLYQNLYLVLEYIIKFQSFNEYQSFILENVYPMYYIVLKEMCKNMFPNDVRRFKNNYELRLDEPILDIMKYDILDFIYSYI